MLVCENVQRFLEAVGSVLFCRDGFNPSGSKDDNEFESRWLGAFDVKKQLSYLIIHANQELKNNKIRLPKS